MPTCGYEKTSGPDFDKRVEICGDQASLRCVTCKTYFCENHDILDDCKQCEDKVRCMHCPEICKTCNDKREVCWWCQELLFCEFSCEDCEAPYCGGCIEEWKCESCGILACCSGWRGRFRHDNYCLECYNRHNE